MVRPLLMRPSFAVGIAAVVVVGVFAMRGDLRLRSRSPAPAPSLPSASPSPVIVRRAGQLPPVATMLRRGRVFDAAGFLVVGALVTPTHGAPVRTDADGAFELSLPQGGTADVLVQAAGQRSVWRRISADSPDELALALEPAAPWDAPPPPPGPLPTLRGEGEVVAASGGPLANAFVGVAGASLWARTDEAGRFVLALPAASNQLFVHAPAAVGDGLAMPALAFVSERERGVVPVPPLAVEAALQVRGILHDGSGRRIDGVPVQLSGVGVVRTGITGPGGAFRWSGLPRGAYSVAPFASRGAFGDAIEVVLSERSLDVELHLQPLREGLLKVIDPMGEAVVGAFVASAVSGMRRGIARTDTDGLVAVPVAAVVQFDVRAGERLTPMPVQHYAPDTGRLVVARP